MSAPPAIVCADLHAEPAWHGLNLVVQPGECAVVAGNGRGKFRLLQLLLGQAKRQFGRLEVLGQDPSALSRRQLNRLRTQCVLAPHNGAVVANMSIWDNVALPLRYHGLCPESEARDRVDAALSALELAAIGSQRPAVLVPEQQRLVSIARLVAQRLHVMLVQDPYEGLDEGMADRVHAQLTERVQAWAACLLTTQVSGVDRAYDGRIADLVGSHVIHHTE